MSEGLVQSTVAQSDNHKNQTHYSRPTCTGNWIKNIKIKILCGKRHTLTVLWFNTIFVIHDWKCDTKQFFSSFLILFISSLWAYQLLCHPTGTSSGNCQETETGMVWVCHTPWPPHQNHPSGHCRGWMMLWSAEEMLDRQHHRMDTLAHARAAHKHLLQKRLEEDLCCIIPNVPLMTKLV